jgi:hypothetical protein
MERRDNPTIEYVETDAPLLEIGFWVALKKKATKLDPE